MTRPRLALYLAAYIALIAGIIWVGTPAVTMPVAHVTVAADGGRALSAPPPAADATVGVSGNPAAYRYVTTYWAQDLNRFNLSAPINAAAHRYHLSPVGLLSIVLSECNGYTNSPRCDRYGNWPDWSHGSCQVSDATAGQFGVGNGTEYTDAYVKAFEDNPTRCIWLAAKVLRNFKNAWHVSFPLLAAAWNCGDPNDVYTEPQCYANHQAFLSWWNAASRFGTNAKPTKSARSAPHAVGYDLLDSPAVEQRLWRIPALNVVESSTVDEAGLTGGYQPIRDTDVMVPQWTHQRIYLPGHSWDFYQYRGCLYIYGSGDASLWLTPTDQYFAILHMDGCPFGGATAGPPINTSGETITYSRTSSSDQNDLTGEAFDALLAKLSGPNLSLASGLRKVRGGSYIGLTGWPSSYQYSNGSCYSLDTCGQDAHACFVETSGASNWFLWLAEGHDRPRPAPIFRVKVWNHYTSTHHKKAVPAYRKHRLRAEAHFWLTHQKALGYVMHEETWHKKGGYEAMSFTKCVLRYTPKTGHFAVVKRSAPSSSAIR